MAKLTTQEILKLTSAGYTKAEIKEMELPAPVEKPVEKPTEAPKKEVETKPVEKEIETKEVEAPKGDNEELLKLTKEVAELKTAVSFAGEGLQEKTNQEELEALVTKY